MGVNYGLINHTKREYIEFDRRFHTFQSWPHGEYICRYWSGDKLEIGNDTGGLISDLYEGPGGLGNYKRLSDEEMEKALEAS